MASNRVVHLSGCACMALFSASMAQAAEPPTAEPDRYVIKQDRPSIGTHIPRNVVEASRIPLNKRYDELTGEQRALIKSQYESMAAGDEPPFPANGLAPIYKTLARAQQSVLVKGPVVIFVDVNAAGEATAVQVLQSPDPQFSRYVASVLMREKYKPARCGGTPCAMQYPFRMTFAVR